MSDVLDKYNKLKTNYKLLRKQLKIELERIKSFENEITDIKIALAKKTEENETL